MSSPARTRRSLAAGWRYSTSHATVAQLIAALLLHICDASVTLRGAAERINRASGKTTSAVTKSSLHRLYQSLPASLRDPAVVTEASLLEFIQLQQAQQRVSISDGLSLLTQVEEELLAQWVVAMWEINYPVTRSGLKDRALLVINAQRGTSSTQSLDHWYKNFRWRHPELQERVTQNVSKCRLLAQQRDDNIAHYYSLLARYKDLPPAQIFAGDETGLDGDGARGEQRLAPTGASRVCTQLDSYREHTSLLHIGNAAGRSLPIVFMFKGAELDATFIPQLPADALVGAQKSGYFTGEHFINTLRNLDKHGGEARPLLFIIDGCKGHIDLAAIDFARSKQIEILCLPANTTQLLQVADVSLFGPFKHYWRAGCKKLKAQRASIGVDISCRDIKRADIVPLVLEAWAQAMTEDNVKAGFRKTGICPYDPAVYKQSLPHAPLRPVALPLMLDSPAVLAAPAPISSIIALLPVSAPPQAKVPKCGECGRGKRPPRRTLSTGAGVLLTGEEARQQLQEKNDAKRAEVEGKRQRREAADKRKRERATGSVSGRKRQRDEKEEGKENAQPSIVVAQVVQEPPCVLRVHPLFMPR